MTHAQETRKNDRRCIVTGQSLAADAAALRFVLGPNNMLFPDIAGKLPGRGAWVIAEAEAIRAACKKGLFARHLKANVILPDGGEDALIEGIISGLKQNALNALGLLRRSGQVTLGFEKVQTAIKGGKAQIYIAAHDASADGRDRILRLVAGLAQSEQSVRVVPYFTTAELSQHLGVENAVHVALVKKRQMRSFLNACIRLEGLVSD